MWTGQRTAYFLIRTILRTHSEKKVRIFYCRPLFTDHMKELRMFSCVTIQSCMKFDRNQLSPVVKSWRSYMLLFKVDKSFTAVIFQVTWKLRKKDLHQQQLQQPSLPSSPKLPLPWIPGPPWQTRTTVRLTTSFSSVGTSSRSMNPRLWRRAVGRRPCVCSYVCLCFLTRYTRFV